MPRLGREGETWSHHSQHVSGVPCSLLWGQAGDRRWQVLTSREREMCLTACHLHASMGAESPLRGRSLLCSSVTAQGPGSSQGSGTRPWGSGARRHYGVWRSLSLREIQAHVGSM